MLLMFLRLTCFLDFCISLEHGLHEGHTLIAPKRLVGLLGLKGLTCRTILVVVMAVTSIVHLVGVAMGLAMLAKLLIANLLRDSIIQAPRCFPLGITHGVRTGCASLTFCLQLLVLLIKHDLLNSL